MSKAAQYLDAAKERLSLKSDYALAKIAGIRREIMPSIRSGKRAVPLHLAYWLAITLERDPAAVVADLEEEREKNQTRQEFWRSFLSRSASLAVLCCKLALITSGACGNALAAAGGGIKRALGASDNRRLCRGGFAACL